MKKYNTRIYFSDFFNVSHDQIEKYGALDISLICDNPAFVDPFLIFANQKYIGLHRFVIDYLRYLRDLSINNAGQNLESGEYGHYYKFTEVKKAWLGILFCAPRTTSYKECRISFLLARGNSIIGKRFSRTSVDL